jgi:hypothetical protein
MGGGGGVIEGGLDGLSFLRLSHNDTLPEQKMKATSFKKSEKKNEPKIEEVNMLILPEIIITPINPQNALAIFFFCE